MNISDLCNRPLRLKKNRVWRPFKGGKLLDIWQGIENPQDGHIAEEWVASTVEAKNTNHIPNEGLSAIEGYDNVFLRDVINLDPKNILGKKHYEKYGNNMAILVKVLDSYSRLLIQVHPDKEYAKSILNSDFGKTEAWYVIDTREINEEKSYVLFGFKEGITKEKWKELFEKQDIAAMVNALHKFHVKPGDVFLVEGGVPHAAGTGVFFMEIQEPTDFTMRSERLSASGQPLVDFQLHQGVGFDKMFDCFHYDGYSEAEILDRWYIKPLIKNVQDGGKETYVISPSDTSYFSMTRIDVTDEYESEQEEVFTSAVVLSGIGRLLWGTEEIDINMSHEIFLPANLGKIKWKNEGNEKLIIVRCYPPII